MAAVEAYLEWWLRTTGLQMNPGSNTDIMSYLSWHHRCSIIIMYVYHRCSIIITYVWDIKVVTRVGVNSIISTQLQFQLWPISRISTPTPTPEVSTPTPTPGVSTPTPTPTPASLLNINSNSNSGGFNSNSNSGVDTNPCCHCRCLGDCFNVKMVYDQYRNALYHYDDNTWKTVFILNIH